MVEYTTFNTEKKDKTMETTKPAITEETIKKELEKLPRLDEQAFLNLAKNEKLLSNDAYENFIDRLDVSDNWKVFLRSLIRMTKKICDSVVEVGKVVLNIIIDGVRRFPHAIGGAVIGLVLGMLLCAIPLLGPLLSSFVTPFLAVAGGLAGFAMDVSLVVFCQVRDSVGNYVVRN